MKKIPTSTLKRMPQYLEVLRRLKKAGLKYATATKISVFSDIHQTLVRKDLAFTNVINVPQKGFKITELALAIEKMLNWKDTSACYLVGAGKLGSALLGYQEFSQKGLAIKAVFDNDPEVIGSTIHGIQVHSVLEFTAWATRNMIQIGIITVPSDSAQLIADIMVHSGIKAIWNFTPYKIQVPPDIIVEQVDMFASLAVLSRRLAEKK